MPKTPEKTSLSVQRAKRAGLISAAIFLVYVVIGFWVLPPLVKPRMEEQLSSLLGRQVTVDRIKLNPLSLSATLSRLDVLEQDGEPFAGFETLFVNTQLSSIFRWAVVVREIRVQAPFGTLRLLPGNKLNIDDLLARFSKAAPESKPSAGLPRAIIETFQVIDGRATLVDMTGKQHIQEIVSPITFTLENLSTLKGRQGEYRLTGSGPSGDSIEVSGQLTVNPVRVQGHFSMTGAQLSHYWEHLSDLVSFQIIKGSVDGSGDYTLEIVDGRFDARLENGAYRLNQFELVQKGQKDVLISIPVLDVQGVAADLQDRQITIQKIETTDAGIKSWLTTDGTFALRELFLPDLEKLIGKKAAASPDTETSTDTAWTLTLKNLEMVNGRLDFEDRTLTNPAELRIDDIHVVVEDLSTKPGASAKVGVALHINQAGRINVDGTAGIDPLQADLKVAADKIGMKPLQPYLDEAVNAQIIDGFASSSGRVRYRGRNKPPQIRYEGEFSVDNLKIHDRQGAEDFITLVQCKADGISLELLPNQLKVSEVLIDQPHARVTISEAGVINVINAFVPAEETSDTKQANLLQRVVSFLILQFKGPMPITVDRVRLDRFTGDFVDASVSPTFSTHMEITDATVNGLSSDPMARANFKLNGRIDQKATIEGSGQMNPMNALQYSKVDLSLKDFTLQPVSPYSGKFIGFNIADGTLKTDLKYTVDHDQVKGDNIITIDRLELGEKVDSPDALNLPVQLGVTLLKDKDGRITLQVPVTGNVKDPHFDFAKIVVGALTGTIKNVASAPFAALPNIDGFTGERLRTIEFDFGSAELHDSEARKLDALATYLIDRKDLALGIEGTADRRMDGAVLSGVSPADLSPKDDQTPGKASTAVPADLMVDEEALEQLAAKRAEAVHTYLIEHTRIDETRIQRQTVKVNPEPDGESGRVVFSLSVE